MRVKKFQANSMPEAMKQVKAELGANAIILHSRDMRKGLVGFFMGGGVEVTAAIDERPAASAPAPKPSASQQPPSARLDVRVDDTPPIQPIAPPDASPEPNAESSPVPEANPLLQVRKQIDGDRIEKLKKLARTTIEENTKNKKPSISSDALEKRLGNLESQLTQLTGMLQHLAPNVASGDIPAVPNQTRELYNHLLEHDVDEQLALTIATSIADTADEKDDCWTILKTHLMNRIKVAPQLELDFENKKPRVIMLVGPTGVGKTTTLAKISAQYRYTMNARTRPKITFVTADLYRLAAVEQLQKYTEILGVELEVTYSPEEIKQAISKHSDSHLILCDTAGTCQRNVPQINTLKALKEASNPDEVHLVMSSTTKFSDMVDVVEHFREIDPTRLLFTKIDESTTFGSVINTSLKFNIPISYLTTGQNVPEDIETARPEKIAKLLLTKPTVNRSIQWDGKESISIDKPVETKEPVEISKPEKDTASTRKLNPPHSIESTVKHTNKEKSHDKQGS